MKNTIISVIVVVILVFALIQSWILMSYDENADANTLLNKYQETGIYSVIILILSIVALVLVLN